MKKLFINKFLVAVAIACCISCNDEIEEIIIEEEKPETIIPPGEEYIKDGDACFNIFYAIPSDLDSIPAWHKRLSGITLHIQEFYKTNFQEAGYGDKTFNLEINKANPDFIRIHYLELDETSWETGNTMTVAVMKKVTEYYKANGLSSKNHLVYMPEYPKFSAENMPFNGAYGFSSSERPIEDMGFGVLSVDRTDFDIAHLGKPSQTVMLTELANVMHEVGHAFWLQHHNNGLDNRFGMMGYETYSYLANPDSIRFSESDLLRMNELDIFKKSSSEDYFNFNPWSKEIGIQDNRDAAVTYEASSGDILIKWDFMSTKKVVGFMAYIDPWGDDLAADKAPTNSTTEYDAITYLASKEEFVANENNYSVDMRIAWKNFLDRNETHLDIKEGELRFRIIFEGGVTLPVSGFDNKGPMPTALDHRASIRFHFNVQNNIPIFDDYKW